MRGVQGDELPTPDQLMLLCISNRVLSELAGVPLAPTNVAPADAIPHAITIFQRMLRAYTQMFRLTTSLKDEVGRLRDAVSLVSMVTQRLAPGGTYTPQVRRFSTTSSAQNQPHVHLDPLNTPYTPCIACHGISAAHTAACRCSRPQGQPCLQSHRRHPRPRTPRPSRPQPCSQPSATPAQTPSCHSCLTWPPLHRAPTPSSSPIPVLAFSLLSRRAASASQ